MEGQKGIYPLYYVSIIESNKKNMDIHIRLWISIIPTRYRIMGIHYNIIACQNLRDTDHICSRLCIDLYQKVLWLWNAKRVCIH